MKLLFASVATYRVFLGNSHSYWHRVRRLGTDALFQAITTLQPPSEKRSMCRGLWLLASEAKRARHSVEWVDVMPDSPTVSSEKLAWADQLWLYAMTPTLKTCLKLAERAKKENPSILIFLGGPHTRHLYGEILLSNAQIDYAEAVSTSPDRIVSELSNPTAIPGIAYRSARRIRVNDATQTRQYSERPDPSVLPVPLNQYYINTSSSQGCCETCAFCLEGQVPLRLRELDEVKDELRILDEALGNDGTVHFFDASLWAVPKRCMDLTDFLSRETNIRSFSCDLEPRQIREDVLRGLGLARIRTVAMGFESCVNEVLNAVGKTGTFEKRLEAAKRVRSAMPRAVIKAYWLFGLPGSTVGTLRRELDGIRYVLDEAIVDLVSAKLFVPYPGTPFFENPASFGLTLTKNFERFDRFTIPPACFPDAVGSAKLSNTLIECEKLIAGCYAKRLGVTPLQLAANGGTPKRYNGCLYIRST